MKIANKIREVLSDGEGYTMTELWKVANGAPKDTGVMENCSDRFKRLKLIAGDDFLTDVQIERSAKGLVRRGSINVAAAYSKITAGGKTYVLSRPVMYYYK